MYTVSKFIKKNFLQTYLTHWSNHTNNYLSPSFTFSRQCRPLSDKQDVFKTRPGSLINLTRSWQNLPVRCLYLHVRILRYTVISCTDRQWRCVIFHWVTRLTSTVPTDRLVRDIAGFIFVIYRLIDDHFWERFWPL